MNNTQSPLKIQTTITPEFDKVIRRHAYLLNLKENKVLELYQNAYLKVLENEKTDKRIKKELREKGKVKCPYCSQIVYQ